MDAVELLRLLARELSSSPDLPWIDVIADDESPAMAIMTSDGTQFFLIIDDQISPFKMTW